MKKTDSSNLFFRRLVAAMMMGSALALAQAPMVAHAQTPVAGGVLPDFTAIVEKAEPAVVNIRTTATVPVRGGPGGPGGGNDPYDMFRWFFGPDFQPPGMPPGQRRQQPQPSQPEERTVPRGVGSGFFISDDGYIMTNNHVISDAADIIVTLTDGREFKAKVIGSDERTDVALIKIDAKGMTALPIGDNKTLKKGQWVLAIGSPFGLESTVTSGIVSAIGRDTGEYLPFIQTDVAVNPGNSGGPLLNMKGEVVGINSQIISRSGGFMGISLAIPIDEAMRVVEQLRTTGKVTRGRIGVQIGEVGKDVADAIGLPKAEGALVSSVEADGPADKAGVQPGDVILKFNGQTIKRWSDLPRIVGDVKPGTSGKMEVWRKGKPVTLDVKVAELKAEKAASTSRDDKEEAPAINNHLGLSVVDVPADTQRKLRIKGGVQVRAVEGVAASAGLQAGDIVLAVNDTDVINAGQFAKVVDKLDKAKTVGLLVRRGDQTQWVAVQPASK
ncbi:DegQ family serine endoprotease [Bordetella avium]|uniref:Probable periplasmic serine endoprotease DegP-like n=1 Tax=Bordetella avium (strain 197N) TaxID=360910 RepID=Q2KW11_BORA1|nr:DegQ family serine endoprotease [Bordetella avium]AZY48623.1 PDZ domain-containing protein [Bordetella avium]AZY52003.1 PDZ domain-containing protein [Bordetella avium]RIQ13930.1 DegQ family serine endoprotease [Bordetella avium]RIQ16995.1 DegQ family serine endoprotease [Bordetella avium]RIQ36278.1 DegQ family serine endoprotease [Bordetella avium]